MVRRSKEKSYRIVSSIKYGKVTVGPGEPIPSGLSQADIQGYIRQGKIRETDPQTGLNIEPRSSSEIDLAKEQATSFLAKPAPFIAQHLDKTNFSLETLARIHTQAEQLHAPAHVMQRINDAIERKTAPR